MTRDQITSALMRAQALTASSDFDLNSGFTLPAERILRDAAVLVPLIERDNGWNVILTKRPNGMKHHPGQVAFPGGKVDPSDRTLEDAALREAQEEIGLPRDQVKVIGTLPPHETVTNFTIYPFVGIVDSSFIAIPEVNEVEDIFEVPLDHLKTVKNYQIVTRRWADQDRYYYTVPYGPYYIWGATARMLRSFAGGFDAN